MNRAAARTSTPPPVVFRDAFGERRRVTPPGAQPGTATLDVLCLRAELTAVPSFEFALRERVSRLASFRHPAFAVVRTVERLSDHARTLALISNTKPGARLSELLAIAGRQGVVLDCDAALYLLGQLVDAMAVFHEQAPDVAHGTLGPERIVVSPEGGVAIVEHVMGAAVEQLQFPEDRYWRELRVPSLLSPDPTLDRRTDVLQIGMVALALILRRPLQADEFPHRIGEAVVAARAARPDGGMEPLPAGLRRWLTSALQLEPEAAFPTAVEAKAELEKVLAQIGEIGAPALEAFLLRCHERADAPAEPRSTALPTGERAIVETRRGGYQPAPAYDAPGRVEPPRPAVPDPVIPDLPAAQRIEPLTARAAPATIAPLFGRGSDPDRSAAGDGDPAASSADAEDEVPRRGRRINVVTAALLLLSLAGGATLAVRWYLTSAPAAAAGTVTVTTNPPGAQIVLDGEAQGTSPRSLSVRPGRHLLELHGYGEPRTIELDVEAGAQLAQYIELGQSALDVGSLEIRTEPPGARVTLDGVPRGMSPVTVPDLQPGQHTVVVETEAGSTTETVVVQAGTTVSLVAHLPDASGPASGWLSVSAPRTVQLFENGQLLGSSDSERLMVPAGARRLEIVNEVIGFRETRTVQVTAGRVSRIDIEFPKGTVALNATPWAEVWIDGERIGETPIGNLPVTIGPHEIVFRHPELGEQRHVVTVRLAEPSRLSVDMRRQP
jgi:hypothetical protein